jgi:hypothetical protein
MSENKKLTVKEMKVVEALASGAAKTNEEALLMADYHPTTPKSLTNMAHEVMSRPRVQSALQDAIKERYATIAQETGDTFYEIMTDRNNRPMERLKAAELIAKYMNWEPASKHASINLKGDFKLPEE